MLDVDTSELDEPDPVERAAATVRALQARKIEAGVFGLNPADDTIRIRATTSPPADAAKRIARTRSHIAGTSPDDAPRKKMTRAEAIARLGCAPDHLDDDHPLAVAERERQRVEREQRYREFPGYSPLAGTFKEWKPQPRPHEPAPWQQLRALRAKDEEHDDNTTTNEGDEP